MWRRVRLQPGRGMLVHEQARDVACAGGERDGMFLPDLFRREARRKSFMRFAVLALAVFTCAFPVLAEPSYSRDVSRILQAKCQRCHRPNDIAPFPLTKYVEAVEFLEHIGHAVETRFMPPWKPLAGPAPSASVKPAPLGQGTRRPFCVEPKALFPKLLCGVQWRSGPGSRPCTRP